MDWAMVQGIGTAVLVWVAGFGAGMSIMGLQMEKQRLKEGVCPCQN